MQAAEEIAAHGLAQAEALGSPPMAAAAHWLRSLVALFRENVPTALARLQDTLAAVERVAPDAPPFLPAVTLAVVLVPCAGQWVPVFEETALIGSQVGPAQAPGYVWSAIGTAHRLQRDLGSAVTVVRRAAEAFGSVADDAGSALALHQLGCIERDRGEHDAARAHLNRALHLRRQLGDRRGENLTLANLGLTEAAAGDIEAARRLARSAVARGEEVDDGPGVAGSLLNLAVVELFAGDLAAEPASGRAGGGGVPARSGTRGSPPGCCSSPPSWRWPAALPRPRGGTAAEAAALFAESDCRIGSSRSAALAAQAR